MERAFKCKLIWNEDKGFEISERKDTYTVKANYRSCTCRFWNLTGMPCPHGICALYRGGLKLEDCCDDWYTKDIFIKAYSYPLQPIKDEKQYPKTRLPPLEPPQFKKQRGRPKKIREKIQTSQKSWKII
ncbi:uncharacterized protein LOC126672351 [Mercurialis annua]|uniref:uncharacterized protein LOC126672351 n=1 Tax=Mercurialis annua TaxID=3986 RepID=UPI00215F1555|nr:uncharacterized protein LOC126672351 [Mercurialis annua]